MRKITIEFDPETLPFYINGPKFYNILTEFSQIMRTRIKHEADSDTNKIETVESLRTVFYELWNDNMFDIGDL